MPRPSSRRTAVATLGARRKAVPERWLFGREVDEGAARTLARELDLALPFARILVRRGHADPAEAHRFLEAKLDGLHDPSGLPDMPKAVARIHEAVRKKQRIVLFGDYDVDGVSAVALLGGFFEVLGHPAQGLVPERDQGGYGISAQALARIRALKPHLLITLDNGIAAHGPLEALQEEGTDCVVVDHHHVGARGLPKALAVINPKRRDHEYPFTELCGAGLAFKLAWALAVDFSHSKKVSPAFRAFLIDALALAALGTLADVVPLDGENRILAAQGLKMLRKRGSPGIEALKQVAMLNGSAQLEAHDVTFRLAPRLNAAGRCGRAADALELLATKDPARAQALAEKLDGLNRERQAIELGILEDARAQAQERLDAPDAPPALVLWSPEWHPGVIGIVASRLVEEFHRPAVLLAIDEKLGEARGSGRSIPGFHLAEAFAAGEAHLLGFGGHAAAAGLTAQAEQLDSFREAFEAVARERIEPASLLPAVLVDETLDLKDVTAKLCANLARLAPFGCGNPAPRWAAQGLNLVGEPRTMGADERHLSFHVRQAGVVMRAVGFGFGEQLNVLCELAAGSPMDCAFRPHLNTYRDETSVELKVEAFRAAGE